MHIYSYYMFISLIIILIRTAALYLASREAAFVADEALSVNGGWRFGH